MKKFLLSIIVVIFLTVGIVYALQYVDVVPMTVSIQDTAVTVSTSATALPATAMVARKTLIVTNNSSNIIYIGGSSVTASTGTPIYQQRSATFDVSNTPVIYGIAASGSNDIRILELK